MFTARLARLNIRIDNKYDYILRQCEGYIVPETEKPDFCVCVTDEEIMREDTGGFEKGYLESLAVYRKIAERLITLNGFLLHGVILETSGVGVALLARSGTGKSTHAALWLRLLGDKCRIINGDKPLVRRIDGGFLAFGTPWAGKEGIQQNAEVPLRKVCFIERSEENSIEQTTKKSALERLCSQVYLPKNSPLMLTLIDTLDEFISECEFYIIRCNKDISAAEVAYRGLFNE